MSQVPRADSRPEVSLDSCDNGALLPFLHLSWDNKSLMPTGYMTYRCGRTNPFQLGSSWKLYRLIADFRLKQLLLPLKKTSRPALWKSNLLFLFGNQTDLDCVSKPCVTIFTAFQHCVLKGLKMPADPLFCFVNKLPDPKLKEMVLLAQIAIVPLSGLFCQMKKAEGNKLYNSLLLLATFSPMQMLWALSLLRYWLES